MEKNSDQSAKKELPFTTKVWQTTANICLGISIVLILHLAFNILLMVLGGILIAVYFHGLANLIHWKTKLNNRLAAICSVAITLLFLVLLVWFIGAKIQQQVSELSNVLPQTINTTREKLSHTTKGQKILTLTSGDNSQKLLDTATLFFSTSFGVLGNLYIILFFGIFFTADPS
jgi:predicted PurR-regulated permease PerM